MVGAVLLLTGAVKSSGGGTRPRSSNRPPRRSSPRPPKKATAATPSTRSTRPTATASPSSNRSSNPKNRRKASTPSAKKRNRRAAAPRPARASCIDDKGHILTNNHVIEGAKTIEVKLGESDHEYKAEVVGTDPASDLALIKVEAPVERTRPADPGRLREDGSRRPGGRDRQPVRARPDRHQRHRLGAAAADPGAERLLDRQRDPDRRGDQPRQLGRPADQLGRRSDRHQLADRDRRRQRRQRRHRLRDPDQHRQRGDPRTGNQRHGRTRLPRYRGRPDHPDAGQGASTCRSRKAS